MFTFMIITLYAIFITVTACVFVDLSQSRSIYMYVASIDLELVH